LKARQNRRSQIEIAFEFNYNQQAATKNISALERPYGTNC
jgi:DNA-binding MarR family transcriptional regulator